MAYQIENPIGTGTAQERLDICRAAIVAVMGLSQSYTTASGNSLTRADLPTLIEYEKQLVAEVNAQSGRSKVNYASFKRPS